MNQTENIESPANKFGTNSSNSADKLRKIAETSGINNYNSLHDNNKLEEKLKGLKNQKYPNVPHYDSTNNTPSINNSQSNNKIRKSTTFNPNPSGKNNSNMAQKLASKGLNKAGVPKPIASEVAKNGLSNAKFGNPMLNAFSSLLGNKKDELEEQSLNVGVTAELKKHLKLAVIILTVAFPTIFVCLFTVASQVYYKSYNLGLSDALLSDEDASDKINKKIDDGDIDSEVTDEDASDVEAYNYSSNSILAFNYDKSLFRYNKLASSNLVLAKTSTYLDRKYNEASLDDLEDFFPDIGNYADEYGENLVYDFFFKMYNIYNFYKSEYNGVELDLPLLMSTLLVQSEDMGEVFRSNLSEEDTKVSGWKMPVQDYSYDKDWSNQKLSPTDSTHDMEILAQHMISKKVNEYCVNSYGEVTKSNILKDSAIGTQSLTCENGETYEVSDPYYERDLDKYDEFLKEFIEKKYFIDESVDEPQKPDDGDGGDEKPDENPGVVPPTPSTGVWRNWKQCGQSWSKDIVPKSNSTMCSIGCLITSVTIQIARSGTATVVTPIDPGVALKKYSFASGGNFVWSSTTKLAPNFQYRTSINLSGMTREGIAKKLSSYDPSKYYIVLAVSKLDRNKVHHYVAFDYVDLSDNEIYMIDPGLNNNPKLYSVYKVYKAYIYMKKD